MVKGTLTAQPPCRLLVMSSARRVTFTRSAASKRHARRSSSSSSAVVALGGSLDGGLAVQLAQLRLFSEPSETRFAAALYQPVDSESYCQDRKSRAKNGSRCGVRTIAAIAIALILSERWRHQNWLLPRLYWIAHARRRDLARFDGSRDMASIMFQSCFLAVETKERISAKSIAPCNDRKPPEIF